MPAVRVIFEVRAWNAELFMAVEDRWRETGVIEECMYMTHHRQAALVLSQRGRRVLDAPAAVRRMLIEDPIGDLASIEAKYGDRLLPLPRYLMSERFFVGRGRTWQLEQLAGHARLFDELFEGFAADLYVGDLPDLMPLWLAFDMASHHGCEPVGIGASSFPPGRLLLVRSHREIAGASETYESMRRDGLTSEQSACARDLQTIVRGEGTVVDYRPPARNARDFTRRLLTGEVVRNHITRSAMNLRERAVGNWFLQPDPIVSRLAGARHAVRAEIADRRHMTDSIPDLPYVFYPLHLEPEAALLVHGSYFEDQLQVIRNIARSLPIGWQIAVKEHPVMRGLRPLTFYRALRSIPNLRLLPFATPTNEVILRSRIVAVVSGTVGLEASVIGKPVLMFGEFPWDYAPGVRRVGKLDELPRTLAELADGELGADHPDVLAFVASWDASLPKGRFFKHRGYDWLEPENVRRIADALRSKAPATVALTRP